MKNNASQGTLDTGSSDKVVRTLCGLCHTNCGMIISVKNGVIDKVRGDPENPGNRGKLCPKAAAVKEFVYSPERLRHPLLRTENGLEPISWDQALDIIANKFGEIKEKYGPEAVVLNRGAPVTQDVHDAFTQLMAAFGSPNATGPSHLCHWPIEIGMKLVTGRNGGPDYPNTKCVIFWASNPLDSTRVGEGVVFGRYDKVITEAKSKGVKVIVIDPFRTAVAAKSDKWLPIWPGTDVALGLAMLHTIITEGLYDHDFVAKWTTGFNELKEHVKETSPAWAEKITGVSAGDIQWAARTYAASKPASILPGNGLEGITSSVDSTRVIGMLEAVTGNLDIPGGNVFFPQVPLSRYPTVRPDKKPLGSDEYPLFTRLSFPVFADAVITGKPYRPRALLAYHSNPLLINANEKKVREALQKLDFIVVFDMFKTATAELAHLILPAASCFEKDGFRPFSSPEGAFVALRQKVIEPLPDCRSWVDVEYEIARRMGLADTYPWTNTEEWINYRLKPSEVTVEQLRQKHVVYVTPPVKYMKYTVSGFSTPSKKVELYSDTARQLGYDPLPVYKEPAESLRSKPEMGEKFPLIGTTRRPGVYIHTRLRNMPQLRKLEPAASVRINPGDAQKRKISEGDRVVVESMNGSIPLMARVTDAAKPGLVVIDFGWGNPGDNGANVNVLTSDGERDPFSSTTSNRRFLCQVKKA
ncbi:MAG: molybdopterin-dependent oxidoreductase [Dehalococcoidia bacterium]|nr:molybdopterin-dependent oxidoreductase [Dehalococcoidia bacterium]